MMVPPRFVFQRPSLFRYDERRERLLVAGCIEVSECIVQTVDRTSRPEFAFVQDAARRRTIRKSRASPEPRAACLSSTPARPK